MPRTLVAVAVGVRVAGMKIRRHVPGQVPGFFLATCLADKESDGGQVTGMFAFAWPDQE